MGEMIARSKTNESSLSDEDKELMAIMDDILERFRAMERDLDAMLEMGRVDRLASAAVGSTVKARRRKKNV